MVTEMARTMLQEGVMPSEFWGEAMVTNMFILNHSLSRALETQTPMEVLTWSRPSVDFFSVSGCLSYMLVD